ncbi:helix-turn-helix transcriptional regulator [Bradyrhizobium viridifuturi]|uniref:helix-turn-helix transcriptional regulator n=1 Tax=Bradyrhizobium viridifuturi TaxID=1654716 RepID=UPI000A52D087|nr:AraC family transcriptional regulator [Bradyrhizobium viridifuturi]
MMREYLRPQDVASTAQAFGAKLVHQRGFEDMYLQQYEYQPGSWWHDGLTHCRVAVVEAGSPHVERVIGNNRERRIRPAGSVSISPAHAFQRWTWNSYQRVTILFISHALIIGAAQEAGDAQAAEKYLTPLVTKDDLIKQMVTSLLDECRISSASSRLFFGAAGRFIANYILARYAHVDISEKTSALADWQIKRVVEFMESNLEMDIGLDDLSNLLGMTPDYFCRTFKASVGTAPYRYFVERRIEKSKVLLYTTDQGITEIALGVGFSSHSHFSNTFKKIVGRTPHEFRVQAQELLCTAKV